MSIATYMTTAHGRLRHRFWGTYSAAIGLMFRDAADASACLPMLGDGWHVSPTQPAALVWSGDSKALDACIETLVRFGARREAIASLAKSIDYGEPFDCTFTLPIRGQETLAL